MKVLLVSGIWPPDVGGPASHAPELAAFLTGRGHAVEAITTASAAPAEEGYEVSWVSRRWPVGVRHGAVAVAIARRAAASDIVYATSMIGRAALGATAARNPLVIKLTTDEAYERARRRRFFHGDMDEFQTFRGGTAVAALRRFRNAALHRAERIVCPSAYLRDMAASWGVPAERLVVIPNPAPDLPPLPGRAEVRAGFGMDGPTLAFAGRLGRQKALEVALEALGRVEGVSLLVAGDGPERSLLERRSEELGLSGRVRFLGRQPRETVLALFHAADASLLSSAWENFPHTVVESLAVGTPVLATRVGGVAELVEDGENGLLVPAGDPEALANALRRLLMEPGLRERLAGRAVASVAAYGREAILERIEAVLVEAALR